jgi:hypothetical protein
MQIFLLYSCYDPELNYILWVNIAFSSSSLWAQVSSEFPKKSSVGSSYIFWFKVPPDDVFFLISQSRLGHYFSGEVQRIEVRSRA